MSTKSMPPNAPDPGATATSFATSDVGGGEVVTFYSYKGGTGRSMLLANVAWILASSGFQVLVVDWDLEAPGLHRYLMPFLADAELTISDGIIDMMIAYGTEALGLKRDPASERQQEALLSEAIEAHSNVLRYATSVKWKFPGKGSLDFIGSGRQGPSYAVRVNTFDWRAFYERLDGGRFVHAVRESMKRHYEIVLLDSRTGVSDTSGICTVQMPDSLVVCFTLNNQSIEGVASIVGSVLGQRAEQAPEIFPVMTRVDSFEKDKLDARVALATQRLGHLPARLPDRERLAYWGKAQIPYVPYYGYEEVLAHFVDRHPGAPGVLTASTEIASYLADRHLEGGPLPSEEDRAWVLRRYAGIVESASGETRLPDLAEKAFLHLPHEEASTALSALTRLVEVGPTASHDRRRAPVPQSELNISATAVHSLTTAGVLLSSFDESGGQRTVVLGGDELMTRWSRLAEYIEANRGFLQWRQNLRTYLGDWQTNRTDTATLLGGKLLRTGKTWRQSHGGQLSKEELEYLGASVAAAEAGHTRMIGRIAGTVTLAIVAVAIAWSVLQTRQREAILRNLLTEADLAQAAGQQAFARSRYLAALDIDGTTAATSARIGRGLSELGDYPAAEQAFTKSLGEALTTSALTGRAVVRSRRNDMRGALADFQRASTESLSTEFLGEFARVHLALGDTAAATRSYELAYQRDSTSAQVMFDRGLLLAASGQGTLARRSFELALEHAKDSLLVTAASTRIRSLTTASRPVRNPIVTRPVAFRTPLLIVVASREDSAVTTRLMRQLSAEGVRIATPRIERGAPNRAVVYHSRADQSDLANRVGATASKLLAGEGYLVRFSAELRVSRNSGLELRLPNLKGASPGAKY